MLLVPFARNVFLVLMVYSLVYSLQSGLQSGLLFAVYGLQSRVCVVHGFRLKFAVHLKFAVRFRSIFASEVVSARLKTTALPKKHARGGGWGAYSPVRVCSTFMRLKHFLHRILSCP